jgi:HK97 family phage prohead protease
MGRKLKYVAEVRRKTFGFKLVKADEEQGIVEAIVATYDVDSYNEQIVPGAFADSIAAKAANKQADGGLMPWVWSHQSNDPNAFLGSVMAMEEREGEGLWVQAQHDMEDPDSAKAFRLIKSGRVNNYSFAYDAEFRESESSPGVTELTKIEIFEAGPTLVGVNRNTRTIEAKAHALKADEDADAERKVDVSFEGDWTDAEKEAILAAIDDSIEAASDSDETDEGEDTPTDDGKAGRVSIKAGRVLSSKNESAIREAVDKLNGVLDSLADQDDSDEPAKANRTAGRKGKGKTPDDLSGSAVPSLDELALDLELYLS